MKRSFGKINIKGGILSVGDLRSIVKIFQETGVKEVQLGERQTINFTSSNKIKGELINALKDTALEYEIDRSDFPNIISSYATEDIFSTHPWISEGMYRDILNSFAYNPRLKINISDNTQALVPLFTGHLNFIPSTHVNFYYLYINHPVTGGLQCWNKLIYTNDISRLSKLIEEEISKEKSIDIALLSSKINSISNIITMDIDQPLVMPRLRFPYYEGMNKVADKFWLGIYRRKNDFSVDLLNSIFELCNQTKIGQINITPWKSILIKGIGETERLEWEKLLSAHGINSRHSSIELNWQVADNDPEALSIKNNLVKDFDEQDIRTYGLTFAIDTGKDFDKSCSVIIRRKPSIFKARGFFKFMTMYEIFYTPDFSSNPTNHVSYANNISWNALAFYLRSLSAKFYKQLNERETVNPEIIEEKLPLKEVLFQCMDCFTIYDEKIGDPQNGIAPGTLFKDLMEEYLCPLCENPKSHFSRLEEDLAINS